MEPEQASHFEAELWRVDTAKAPWHFVTVPPEISHQIRFYAGKTNSFGSIRVRVCIGNSEWATSLFPDTKSGCYFLPVKAVIRRAESLAAGDRITVDLTTG